MPKVIYSIIMVALLAATVACAGASGKKQTPAKPAADPQVQDLEKRMTALDKRVATLEKAETAPAKAPANLAKTLAALDQRVATLEKAETAPAKVPPALETALRDLGQRTGAMETQLRQVDKTVTELKVPPAKVPPALETALAALDQRVATLEKAAPPVGKIGPTPTPTSTPTPMPQADLRVARPSASFDADRTKLTVAGEVVNLGNATAPSFTLIVTLYKWDGTVLGGKTGAPIVTALGPGLSSPFTISFTSKEVDFNLYGNFAVAISARSR